VAEVEQVILRCQQCHEPVRVPLFPLINHGERACACTFVGGTDPWPDWWQAERVQDEGAGGEAAPRREAVETIWKYPVPIADTFTLELAPGARPLSVQCQDGAPFLWVLLDPSLGPEPRHFHLLGTGHPRGARSLGTFLGTFQLAGGTLVFHLFAEDAS